MLCFFCFHNGILYLHMAIICDSVIILSISCLLLLLMDFIDGFIGFLGLPPAVLFTKWTLR